MILFLDKFIPVGESSDLNENLALSYSPSHYFFGLQLVLHYNIFLRFYKIKLTFALSAHKRLLDKFQAII
jgi:hypothetical protein